ncbi:NTP transferase domain-containing protein [Rhodopila sp.]|uniref:phosphocholine cytidylyltransferase family protein n=1 Tax=Rhodopila sp. TaxID=2480087 RepID=UPI003D0AD126
MSIDLGGDLPTCALILAAGMGRRLGSGGLEVARPGVSEVPKALLEFGGRSLLARHVAILRGLGIGAITVVIGFGAERMRAALAGLADGPAVSVVMNPDYREGSVVSLWAGRAVLRGGGPVILMDADVLYDARLMGRLVNSRKPDCLLLDREIEPGDEPVKLCVRDGRIVDFHKRPTEPHDWHGESVGFFRLSAAVAEELAGRSEAYVDGGGRMMEYEEPIRDMIRAAAADRFGFEDISGLPWTEIDFPEDLVKARALAAELSA